MASASAPRRLLATGAAAVSHHASYSKMFDTGVKRKPCTLVFLLEPAATGTAPSADAGAGSPASAPRYSRVLLGLKKRGFGAGNWNGFGGKVEKGETVIDGALREMEEEVSVRIQAEDLVDVGIIDFEFENKDTLLEVHVFKALKYQGTPTESEEMRPQWFDIADIPFDNMWPDDRVWFPRMLRDSLFRAYAVFKDVELLNFDFTDADVAALAEQRREAEKLFAAELEAATATAAASSAIERAADVASGPTATSTA